MRHSASVLASGSPRAHGSALRRESFGYFLRTASDSTPRCFAGSRIRLSRRQTAEVMVRFEKTILERQPDMVLVYGDVNSTVAATLVCAKLGIKLAHVEAGLRSYDRTMPEEINRLVTDQLADLLLIPSEEAEGNLLREGVAKEKIHFVGNVMIDTLRSLLSQARMPEVTGLGEVRSRHLHRPSNVDEPETLKRILATLTKMSERLQIVFPIHPRTRARIKSLGYHFENSDRIFTIPPAGYLECTALQNVPPLS